MRLRDPWLPLWTAIAFLFALTTGGPFPWFLFYVLAGVVVLSGLWAYAMARGLNCSATVDRGAASVGDVVELLLELENDSWLPVPRMLVIHAGTGTEGRPRVAYLGLGPLATHVDRRPIRLERRGRYRLGPIVVEAQDPLGVFRIRRVVYAEPELTVYPRITPVHDLPVAPRQPFGRQPTRMRAWQDPSSLNDVRPFRPGDNPKHIHWKLSARFGELHVKEFDLRATTDCFLFIDLERSVQAGRGSHSTVEAGVSLAAGVAAYALRRDLSVGGFAHGDRLSRLPAGRGSRHFKDVMRWLVELGDGGDVPVAELLAAQRGLLTPRSSVVVISPALSARLAAELAQLRRQGHSVVLYLLRREAFAAEIPGALGPDATGGSGPEGAAGTGLWSRERRVRTLAGEGVTVLLLGPGETPAPPGRCSVPGPARTDPAVPARWYRP